MAAAERSSSDAATMLIEPPCSTAVSTEHPRPRLAGLLFLAVTVVGWGLNWPLIKILLRDWPPLFSRGIAGLIGAAVLAGLAVLRGERVALPAGSLRLLALPAFTNVFAWMGFTTVAMVWVSVAEGALLVYTMPLWATLLEWPMRGRRPTAWRILSVLLGLAGIAVLLGGEINGTFGAGKAVGVALALVAAVLFAAGTIRPRPEIPLGPLALSAWQVGLGCAPMVALSLLFERSRIGSLSPGGGAALAYMALIPMAACYLSWFEALRRLPAGLASTTTLLTPVIGIVSATLLLGEPLGIREAAAVALTLGGVALALRPE